MKIKKNKIIIFYHYFYPDDVAGATHFFHLCKDLSKRGWEVEAVTSNRSCRNEKQIFCKKEIIDNIKITRIWRPPFKQASKIGRILNAAWMNIAWSILALRKKNKPHIIIVGTDPIFSALIVHAWKAIHGKKLIAGHWCFDLHPEAEVAAGLLNAQSSIIKIFKKLLKKTYQKYDIIADLGFCMKERLKKYENNSKKITLVPWSIAEPLKIFPPNPIKRKELFHDAEIGIMYSGNFGLAHSYEEILKLARAMRNLSAHFVFGVRGNKVTELKNAVKKEDNNISFVDFAPESQLLEHICAADIHIVSLQRQWSGIVVPSKFFGCLAMGRPVIFAGPSNSAIGKWIEKYNVGWVLNNKNINEVSVKISKLMSNKEKFLELQERCFRVYHDNFSKERIVDKWDVSLSYLVGK